ncbi:hypothetical protein SERLADRAFT_434087 [Serpula lacrymans var. lacrymans S7.9]|uniref:Uncharacterized protein n=1 Tax=Serpula lacrymans var. lacrymans (strain S7.9) TaxID=578457 RepID=F8NLN3_SERL9|nr:uncharacterized protein SERLADRAFT_434087 [Serpula lacrymans var. lacrymans S7.9]EGO28214.1 hypothetical protein SERLADRAFT_434087 [Serpula lacrymans var. lacrymans S7.9]
MITSSSSHNSASSSSDGAPGKLSQAWFPSVAQMDYQAGSIKPRRFKMCALPSLNSMKW